MQPVTHPSLRATHGFFSREGGVSEGVYASLNCGPGSEDAPENIAQNRARCAGVFGVGPEALLTCYQIHSPDVLTVHAPFTERPKADALVTNTPGLMLGILTADCAPVLFADAQAGVIGAAHAGWKGAIGGVLENTLASMEALGAVRERIAAVVGPCIQQRSYEVGEEFKERFVGEHPDYASFFALGPDYAARGVPCGGTPPENKFHFDLPGFVMHRLQAAGLKHATNLAMDTVSDEARFFSYRRKTLRNEPDYARQLSAIALT